MPCVYYKFASKLTYDIIKFDGLHISVCNLKKQIMGREKLKAANSDLQITNAENKEEYTDDNALIPTYSSVIVRRIPSRGLKSTSKTHVQRRTEPVMATRKGTDASSSESDSLAQLIETANLDEANASEEDKIEAMMWQSVREYEPVYYRKKTRVGVPPPSYICLRCGQPGHYIKDCPTNRDKDSGSGRRIKKCSGIPTSFLMEVTDPTMKGAMLTNTGKYVIPTLDAEAYAIGKKEKPPFLPEEPSPPSEKGDPIPEDLLCLICKDIMTDAVLVPCCGNSYCDECVRTALLDSDEHTCPTCQQKHVSPDALVANKFLRQTVKNFQNGTGFPKTLRRKHSPPPTPPRPLIQRNLQPSMRSLLSRQQDPLIPVTSSSAHPTPSIASLTSNPSSLAPSGSGNASSAPAPVPDITTATESASVHSEKVDGPFLNSESQSLPAAALTSQPAKGASSTAIVEAKVYQVPVLSSGPGRRKAGSGLGRPGWEHSNKLGYLASPPQQIPRGERSFYTSINRRKHHRERERSQRTQATSLPATPGFLPAPPAPLYLPPPQTRPMPPGVPHPEFPLHFPPAQPPQAGYSVPPPGFPPAPAKTTGVQIPLSNMVPTKQAPPLSREEFYREQGLLKEESKSPYSGSSYFRRSHICSKSRSGSTGSTSCSRSFRCSHSRSYSRSAPYPMRGREVSINDCSRSRTHRYYRRSRSRSSLYSRCHSESRSPQALKGQSPTESKVSQGEKHSRCFPRYGDITPPYDIKEDCGQRVSFRDPFEKEHYQEWERQYHKWYENYQKICSGCAA